MDAPAAGASVPSAAAVFHRRLASLPPESTDEPPPAVMEKMRQYWAATLRSDSFTSRLRQHKEFNNPYILDRVIETFAIDQYGSHYPRSVFDPHGFAASDDFEAIAMAQQAAEEARVAAAAGRTAVSFTSAGPQQVSLFPPGTAAGLAHLAGPPAAAAAAAPAPQAAAPLPEEPALSSRGGTGSSAAISAAIQDARLKAAAAVAASAALPSAAASAAATTRRSRWD